MRCISRIGRKTHGQAPDAGTVKAFGESIAAALKQAGAIVPPTPDGTGG